MRVIGKIYGKQYQLQGSVNEIRREGYRARPERRRAVPRTTRASRGNEGASGVPRGALVSDRRTARAFGVSDPGTLVNAFTSADRLREVRAAFPSLRNHQ
ncbi:hypothetical protein Pta02_26550 [Planobispora takensis]|uniref:Uncharacterized protein n=1 Tax=Planobispora takensis TaxID=1367882 RepID=A0A8J3SUA9_9ACTN|nr:hypothetical protein Pta02_26550 [Planobispora takensis]